jgi:hypothetical protein
MFAKSNNHTPATFQMNSGFTLNGFPCMGAWLSYGLGTENENLPAFVVLPDPRGLPAGGSINWTSGFLPANHQGVPFRTQSKEPVVDLETPASVSADARSADLQMLNQINGDFASAHPGDRAFAARLRSYELAARMQVSIPEATQLTGESETIRRLYGLDDPANKGFARNCLMARRLLETVAEEKQDGVELHCGGFRASWYLPNNLVLTFVLESGHASWRPVARLRSLHTTR